MKEPKKILVHICCAVDTVYFLKRLREDFPNAEIIGFFYDPNIHPIEEYLSRLKETEYICNLLGIKLIEGEYKLSDWLKKTEGYENLPEKSLRCLLCFEERLEKTIEKAKELGCDAFTTTLLMSPKKSLSQLREVAEKLARKEGIQYIHKDYRKGGGVQEMNRLVREKEIWRQDYCGCVYALLQQKKEEALYDLLSFFSPFEKEALRLAGSKEELLFIRKLKAFASYLNLPLHEKEFQFLAWFPLKGYIHVNYPEGKKEIIPSAIKLFSAPLRGKVRCILESSGDNLLSCYKQNLQVQPIGNYSGNLLANPTFLVDEDIFQKLKGKKITAELKTVVKFMKNRILFIGDINASQLKIIPADSNGVKNPYKIEEIEKLIISHKEEIKKKKYTLAIVGAYYNSAGLQFLKQIIGN
jgi:predicted adenine nucleotide alpha hydrolase (AANH) superfamily ATPase